MGESESESNNGRNSAQQQYDKQCSVSKEQITSVFKDCRHLPTKSDCQQKTSPSVCSRDEQRDMVAESVEDQSNGYNHGAKQVGTVSDGSLGYLIKPTHHHQVYDGCYSPDSTADCLSEQQRNQHIHCNVDCYRDIDMYNHLESKKGYTGRDSTVALLVNDENLHQQLSKEKPMMTKSEPRITNTSSEVTTTSTSESFTKISKERVTDTECKPITACPGINNSDIQKESVLERSKSGSLKENKTSSGICSQEDLAKHSAERDGIIIDLQHSGHTKADDKCKWRAALHTITLDEARLSLLKLIVFLESHPTVGSHHLPQLWQLLKIIEEYGKKVLPEKVEPSCNIGQNLKQPAEGVDSQNGYFDESVVDDVSDLICVKNRLVSKLSEACGLNLKCSKKVEEHEKQPYGICRTKPKRMCAKINVPNLYAEQQNSDDYDKKQDLFGDNVEVGCDISDKPLTSYSLEDEDAIQTKQDSKHKRKKEKDCVLLNCNVCGKHFKNPSHLKEHSLTHTSEKPFKCEVCGKGFRRQGYIKQHKLLHTGEKPFPCTVCSKQFRSVSELKQHSRIHTGEKPHKCDSCSARFAHAGGLKSHARTHTGDRAFTCNICGAQLAHAGSLKVHVMRAHTREKPFICATCGKAFTTSADLKTHQKTHTGERPYVCTMCTRRFSQCGQLKTHMRTHTGEKPYLCTMCGKGFAHTSSLSVHMRGHTGERPYRCTLCDMRCSDSTNLKKHMRLHMNENLFKCTMCGQNFSHLRSLNKHMTMHTSSDDQQYHTHNTASVDQTGLHYQDHIQNVNNFIHLSTHDYSGNTQISK